jgi:hypothetical protein
MTGNDFVEWCVPSAALDWDYTTQGREKIRQFAVLFLRLFLPTLAVLTSVLYFVLPERLNVEFFGLFLLFYVAIGTTISATPFLGYRESRWLGIAYRIDKRGVERKRGRNSGLIPWKNLRRWERRIVRHPGLPDLMAIELSRSFRGDTIRRYLAFDPDNVDVRRIAQYLQQPDID